MKVFLSWSGARSMAAAELLKWWTRSIIQAARPWISSEDLDRGSLWFSEINDSLSDTSIGIVCLTQENKDRPWILFEAGALAKGLSNSRVCTFLVDLNPSDIRDPLAQFNHTQPKEDDMRKLARTLNRQLGENALDDAVLTDAFNAYWEQFQKRWEALMKSTPAATNVKKRPADDIMTEILDNVRGMNQRIRALEAGVEQTPSWIDAPVRVSAQARISKLARERKALVLQLYKDAITKGTGTDTATSQAMKWGLSPDEANALFRNALDQVLNGAHGDEAPKDPTIPTE